MERFKQENSIAKISIGENVLDGFVETTKEFKKLDEVDDSDKIINMKKNAFESCPTVVFIRVLDKRKYWELIHDFSVQYEIKNDQYPKTLQESLDVMRKLKFKSENKNDKRNTQKQN